MVCYTLRSIGSNSVNQMPLASIIIKIMPVVMFEFLGELFPKKILANSEKKIHFKKNFVRATYFDLKRKKCSFSRLNKNCSPKKLKTLIKLRKIRIFSKEKVVLREEL